MRKLLLQLSKAKVFDSAKERDFLALQQRLSLARITGREAAFCLHEQNLSFAGGKVVGFVTSSVAFFCRGFHVTCLVYYYLLQ